MSENASDGLKIAVVLALLAVLIILVLNVVSIATSTTNSSISQLQNSISGMSTQGFETYNQTTIAGSEVLAALSTYNDQEVAMIVSTLKQESDPYATSSTFMNYGALLEAPASNDADAINSTTSTSDYTLTGITTYNSNTGRPTKYVADYQTDSSNNDEIMYNWKTSATKTKGSDYYINPTGKFYACLIYDTNNEIIGMAFRQVS